MLSRVALRSSEVLRVVSARPAQVSVSRALRAIHSSSSSQGTSIGRRSARPFTDLYHSFGISIQGAYLSQPSNLQIRRYHKRTAHIWLLPNAVPSQIHPTVLCSKGRTDSVYGPFRRRPPPYLSPGPLAMSIQECDGYQRSGLPRAGEEVRGGISLVERKIWRQNSCQDLRGRG